MPLSKERDRDRKRAERGKSVQPVSNLSPVKSVQPRQIPGLIMEGNRILGAEPVKRVSIVPGQAYISDFEVDADGNIIPSYT